MIFVDTSTWISYFRKIDPLLNEKLDGLLDQQEVVLPIPVQIELLSGSRKDELKPLQRVLSALPLIYPTQATWNLIEEWILEIIQRKEQFGFADLLIAAIVHENNGSLWSLDKDFERLAKFKLVKLFTLS